MNVAGIIMECNPFHEGHAFVIEKAREETGADFIIAAMSGDYVQRGEPALFDKYIRAEQILSAGADLVLELPMYTACGSAEYFARGGVSLLKKLGVVTSLCFGSESGHTDHLVNCARILAEAETSFPSDYQEKLDAGLRAGMTFPAARAKALDGQFPSAPNDLLGVEYCRAVLTGGSPLRVHAIPRIDVPSATQRRKILLKNREALLLESASLSYSSYSSYPQTSVMDVPVCPIGTEDFSSALMYALRMEASVLEQYADVSSGLADRIRSLLPRYHGYSDFTDLLKTRNMTRTRISRCLLHILLRMRQERLDLLCAQDFALYARPLAINRKAAPLFAAIRQNTAIPFLSKLAKAGTVLSADAYSFLQEEIRAEELYTLTLADTFRRIHGAYHPAGETGSPSFPSRNTQIRQDVLSRIPAAEQRRIRIF